MPGVVGLPLEGPEKKEKKEGGSVLNVSRKSNRKRHQTGCQNGRAKAAFCSSSYVGEFSMFLWSLRGGVVSLHDVLLSLCEPTLARCSICPIFTSFDGLRHAHIGAVLPNCTQRAALPLVRDPTTAWDVTSELSVREPTAYDYDLGTRYGAWGQVVLGRHSSGAEGILARPPCGGHPCQGDAISLHYWFAFCLSRSHDDKSGLNLGASTSHRLLLMDTPISS